MLNLLSKDEIIRRYLELEKYRKKLESDLEKVKGEKEALEKELRKYKNSNTPPSAHPHLKPIFASVNKTRKKRGAPAGHTGITRPKKEPDEMRRISATECPNCHSKDFKVIGTRRQQIEERPPDIRPTIIDVIRDFCRCNRCKTRFVATDGRTPIQGKFGINLIVLVIFLKFIVRGVLRKTASFLESGFAMRLAPASVQAIIERAAKAGEAEYQDLKQKIRTAPLLYIDETSFRVLGANWWVWAFRSDTDLLFAIRNSRGSNVLEEVLGKEYSGIVVCDCWRAYDFLSLNATLQRCWAHLLRKSAELESVPGRHLHKKLTALFGKIKLFNSKERTKKQRERRYRQMTAELKKITSRYSRHEECESVAKYAGVRIESWFTCVRFAGVEPTNNYAEQAIRETVLVRKIIGAFRSETGTKVYETLASLIATWQFQKKDLRAELCRMLSANLCG